MNVEMLSHFRTGWLGLMLLVALSACTSVARREAPILSSRDAVPIGFPPDIMYVDDGRQDAAGNATRLLWRVRQSANGGHINVLALSGGGSGIAFGAGALVGWTRSGTRPEFQIVTGVSAGALLAPLAFLGSSWDPTVSEAFSGSQTQHLLQSHWMRAWFGASVYRGEPLVELVDRYVTDELLRAVAAEYLRGRVLLVGTTDLDHKRTVIWDMGRIAVEGGERARRLFRDILVASASIPGVFPPVLVRVSEQGHEFDEMHVDGGTTSPFFIAPVAGPLSAEELRALEGATVYVIVNGQLGGSTVTTPVRTVSIFRRGLDAALESSSRAAVEEALTTSHQADMTLRVSEIPDDYPVASWLDMGRANMGALFDFGLRCATENGLWDSATHALERAKQSDFSPPGAPASCPAPAIVASNTYVQ